MISTFGYEIGAIFLLCALTMYGTLSGVIPKAFQAGKPGPIILGVLVVGFALYRFGPDLVAGLRSTTADLPSMIPPHSEDHHGSPPADQTVPPPPPLHPAKAAVAHGEPVAVKPRSKAAVIDSSIPAANQPSPGLVQPLVPSNAPAEVPQAPAEGTTGADAVSPAARVPARDEEASGDDPYDSGLKRGLKRVGRFLHIGRKKTDQR